MSRRLRVLLFSWRVVGLSTCLFVVLAFLSSFILFFLSALFLHQAQQAPTTGTDDSSILIGSVYLFRCCVRHPFFLPFFLCFFFPHGTEFSEIHTFFTERLEGCICFRRKVGGENKHYLTFCVEKRMHAR